VGGIKKQASFIHNDKLYTLVKEERYRNADWLPIPFDDILAKYSRSYEEVAAEVTSYNAIQLEKVYEFEQEPNLATVSLWLENAMCGDLFVLVIDDDSGEDTELGDYIRSNADFSTRSKSGVGSHSYFGIRKDNELWDSLNILSGSEDSYISKTGLKAADGTKIDIFCDTPRFIYEKIGFYGKPLTDKTEVVAEILRRFEYKRTTENKTHRSGKIRNSTSYGDYSIMTKEALEPLMETEQQQLLLDALEGISSKEHSVWYSIGCDLSIIFADNPEVGLNVYVWWSYKDYQDKFDISQPIRSWDNICDMEGLYLNSRWNELFGIEDEIEVALDALEALPKRERTAEVIAEEQESIAGLFPEHPAHEAAAIEAQETYQNPDGSYTYDGLNIKLQENSSNFILPQFCGIELTAYEVIKRLAGEQHFKAYKTKMNFPSGKLDLLSYSERSRAGFDFRFHYKMPLILENADAIAAFIEMAISHTESWDLKTNWSACLEITANDCKAAASLFVGYGWANKYSKEFLRVENAFYIVERRNGARHYKIVEDSIEHRFRNIESRACSADILYIIGNHRLSRTVKNNQLQAILKPLLWWDIRQNSNDKEEVVRLSLTAAAIEDCDRRISEYINSLLNVVACTYEHISRIEIDKSDLELEFAAPHEFTISIEDIEFIEYRRSDVAKRNIEDAAALAESRGKKMARVKFDLLKGDSWSGNELQELGYTRQQIKNYCTYGWIKVVGKNGKTPIYERVIV